MRDEFGARRRFGRPASATGYDFDYGARGAYRYAEYGRRLTEGPAAVASSRNGQEPSLRSPAGRHPGSAMMFGGRGPREELDDLQIMDEVRERLFQDSFVNPRAIEVDVREGVVTLRGEVRDFLEARYAWDDAWETRGVRGVVNNLTVRTDQPRESLGIPQSAGE
jgi:hypothetical protein